MRNRWLPLVALAGFLGLHSVAFASPLAPHKHGRSVPPAHSVSRDNLARLQARLAAGALLPHKAAGVDSVRLLALRIEFPDLAFGASPPADQRHDRFYYQTQFHYVTQYFDAASKGRLGLRVDVADVVARAAHPEPSYGDVAIYDSSMVELTREAVQAADSVVDFSGYDGVIVVHAGPGQESDINGDSPTQIWSGFLDDRTFHEVLSRSDSTATGITTADGVEVRNVVVLPEWQVQDLHPPDNTRLGSLGVYAHEIGQRLGLIPLFDSTPSPVPDSQGLGNFDVMAYGLWVANGFIPAQPSAFNRLLMGWLDPVEVNADATVALRDLERGTADSTVVRVRISEREYFLVSYVLEDPDGPHIQTCAGQPRGPQRFFQFDDRNADCAFNFIDHDADGELSPGDDIDSYAGAEWDFFMTDQLGGVQAGDGYGLLVLHVDEQALQDVLATTSNNVEGDPRRKAVDVEEADGIQDLDSRPDNTRSFGSADDYWVRGHVFGPDSDPNTRSVNGAPTGIRITLVALPDSVVTTPGGRAQVRIEFGPPAAQIAAPRRTAWRDDARFELSDLVALPLTGGTSAVVALADSGRIFLLDRGLADAAHGTPGLTPWNTLAPALRGSWAGPPAVGDIDGDGAADLVVAVNGASFGAPVARIFAWHADGSEVWDRDANPSTRDGLLTAIPGSVTAPALYDFKTNGQIAIAVASAQPLFVPVVQLSFLTRASDGSWALDGTPHPGTTLPQSAPIAAQTIGSREKAAAWLLESPSARTVEVEGRTTTDHIQLDWTHAAVQMASGDLDGDATDDLVLVSDDGQFWTHGRVSTFADTHVSPLALADLDGDGTLEVVFAGTRALHVLSATGAELHGWPDAFSHEPGLDREPEPGRDAGAPLVADLDGDGRMEVLLHLRGGALQVWNRYGSRVRDLEAALPARTAGTPLLADLDGDGRQELIAAGRFASTRRYWPAPDSLIVVPRGELAVFDLPRLGNVAWGEAGGNGAHTYRDERAPAVQVQSNDSRLASFTVGPNPAAEELRGRVALTAPASVAFRLYTIEGQLVRAARRTGTAGTIVEFALDVRGLAPGAYVAHMELSTGGQRVRPVVIRR